MGLGLVDFSSYYIIFVIFRYFRHSVILVFHQFPKSHFSLTFYFFVNKDFFIIFRHLSLFGFSQNSKKSFYTDFSLFLQYRFFLIFLNVDIKDTPPLLRDYPTTQKYKYLGTTISPSLSLLPHLKEITRKVNFVTFKLRAVLNRGHFRLNCNLFQVFLLP